MGNHYSVKIGINYRYDHYTSGIDIYHTLSHQLSNAQFDPFRPWWMHKCISHIWDMKKNKIKIITFIFIRRKSNIRLVDKIISLKIDNCKVIDKFVLNPNLVFDKNDPQYENLIRIKLF